MPVEYDIAYILSFRIAVPKFFEKVYSLSVDISDLKIPSRGTLVPDTLWDICLSVDKVRCAV